MPKFRLTCEITVSAETIVTADSLEEAIKIADDRPAEMEFIGSGTDVNESWLVSEIDGSPNNIKPEGIVT